MIHHEEREVHEGKLFEERYESEFDSFLDVLRVFALRLAQGLEPVETACVNIFVGLVSAESP